MHRIIGIFVLMCLSLAASAQNLSIQLDMSNAKKTLELLGQKTLDQAGLEELAQMESTQALLKKIDANDSLLMTALQKAMDRESLGKIETRFQYPLIIENIDSIAAFVASLEKQVKKIERHLEEAFADFIPPDRNINIRIIGILGGHSTGYTFGDPDQFYVSLHHLQYDFDYLLQLCNHELFHNLQSFWYDARPIVDFLEEQDDEAAYYSYLILDALYREGTASYVDGIEGSKETPANSAWLQRISNSKKRVQTSFYLFDRLMVDLYQHHFSPQNANRIYTLFFTTQWDECGYYLGKRMTQYLLEQSPEISLKKYLAASPLLFISDYIHYSSTDDDPDIYKFSPAFIEMVEAIKTQIEKAASKGKH